MGSLTGSAPKATTTSTISGAQTTALDYLLNLLTGQTGTQSTDLTSTSLTGLENIAGGTATSPSSAQTGDVTTALDTLATNLGYSAPKIDATSSFEKGVVKPLTQNFTDVTLPAIAGKYGTSAGGAYSSDAFKARDYAGKQLDDTLAAYGSQYQFAADLANQQADISSAGVRNVALAAAPSTINEPETLNSSLIKNFLALLGGGTLNTTNLATAALSPTQQTVSSGGSTGLLGGLLQGLGSNTSVGTGIVSGIGSLFSDENVKEDIKQVGEVDGFPVYTFRFKGDDTRQKHLGLIAQDVEKKLPRAVGERGGIKTVDYGAVLESILNKKVA